jgi:hypothetical protein
LHPAALALPERVRPGTAGVSAWIGSHVTIKRFGAEKTTRFQGWLNSNKGTKRDMAFRLSPLIDWIFGLWATPKTAPHLIHQFWGVEFRGKRPATRIFSPL